MNSKIVVTGGYGFLGRAVCKILHEQRKNYVALEGRSKYDLTKQKHVDYLFQEYEPDVIIHLAARVGGIEANKNNPGLFMYDNLAMGMNLIETSRKYEKLSKFIMIGTVCSYPKITPVPFWEGDLWKGYPEKTNAPYGIAKKTLMELLAAYHDQYGLDCCNLIPVNMYGPNDNFDPRSSHVIPAIILKMDQAIRENRPSVELWGTGNASREFLYVDDCAEAIVKSIDVESITWPINIGTGVEYKISELATIIAEVMGYKGNVVFNANGLDGQPRRCLDTSQAKQLLGFTASTSLRYGLKKTVKWFNMNKERFVDYIDYIH